MERTSEPKPVTIVAIGAGNRTNKYLEYAIRNPDRLKLVGVAELNDIRRHAIASKFGLKPEECFADYERFFENPVPADAILIGTPENMHFEPCMKAIEAGYNVLLEKPIAQSLPECCRIAEAARRKGVIVGVCHVLRYHPYFIKIKEIVDSGQLGEIISISHLAAVGLDRTTHGFVRGMWRREEITNPMLISKCCHDIDFLLWLTEARCRKLSSFGSLRWFRAENAPKGSTPRCKRSAPTRQWTSTITGATGFRISTSRKARRSTRSYSDSCARAITADACSAATTTWWTTRSYPWKWKTTSRSPSRWMPSPSATSERHTYG